MAFADPLRKGSMAIDPIVGHHPLSWWQRLFTGPQVMRLSDVVNREGWERAKRHSEVRRFIQRYGTEGGRDVFGYDCWVILARQAIANLLATHSIVVTDVRFENEADLIRELGGVVIRVIRPGLEASNDFHRSERIPFTADYTVLNSDTVQILHEQIKAIVLSDS